MTNHFRAGLHVLVLVATGCSGFESQWNEATAARNEGVASATIEGPWQGQWFSEPTGHSGDLRCIITRADDGSTYTARYKAAWGWIFSFEYTLPMQVSSAGVQWTFSGEADLGWLWGTYQYEGTADGERFEAVYRTTSDHGTFTMGRPAATEDAAGDG